MKNTKKILFRSLALSFFITSLTCPPAFALQPDIFFVEPDYGPSSAPTHISINGNGFEQTPKVALYGGGPHLIGSAETPGRAMDVYVSGKHAYVADGDSGLQVIDISDPTQPVIVGVADTPGYANSVYVSGNYAYVNADGLKVINISDPTNPTLVGFADTQPTYDVYVADNHAYLAAGNSGLQVIDMFDPTQPVIVGSVDTPGSAVDVYVAGNHAYVAWEGPHTQYCDGPMVWGVDIVDISDATQPITVGSLETPGGASGVYVLGDFMYVAASSGTKCGNFSALYTIVISDPTNPEIIGAVETINAGGGPTDIYVSGNIAYMADGYSGLQVINISDPAQPIIIGSADTPGEAFGVYVSGNHAYVADRWSGIQVVDISDPTNPTLVGFADTPGTAYGVYVSDNHAYVAAVNSGIQVIDISDPTNPTLVGFADTPGTAIDVYVSDNHAYVADGNSGLQVLRTLDPCTDVTFMNSNIITATVPAGLPEGTYNLHVVNPNGERAILHNSFTIIEMANQPPTAICQDVIVPTEAGLCSADASIDDGSFDPDGEPITLVQTPPGPYALGDTDVTLTVTDDNGAFDICDATVTVIDKEAPIISSVSANPNKLWPPNHKMVPVTVSVDATDNCTHTCRILSVKSNEPVKDKGYGNKAPDWQIVNASKVKLRAERAGKGDGRIYTIKVRCTDESGNSSTDITTVTVPHDKGKKSQYSNKNAKKKAPKGKKNK